MATRTLRIPAFLAQTPQPVTGPISLSGQRYLIRLWWSPLAGWSSGAWLSDLRAGDGTAIALAVPLVLTADLWALHKSNTRAPQGKLAIVRVSGEGDPGPLDLGASVVLEYSD